MRTLLLLKKFTIEYNKTPFDLTAQERQDEVMKIVRTVLQAYNFKEFEKVYLKDSSSIDEQKSYKGYLRQDIEQYQTDGIIRKPAF